ncbi:sensor histidine kinase [Cohnella soli]|uniref:histidine kinase n=1 Tax=Cohnella soli TaxID=425005 RepID=A0ABW0HUF8_9BACL
MAKLADVYHAFFRTKLFNKIVLVFSALTIVTFCTLAVLVYKYSTSSLRQKELAAQQQAVNRIGAFLDEQMDQSQDAVLQFYQNQLLLNDMLYFLRNDMPLYIQYRFNKYIASNSSENRNLETFLRSHMESHPEILQIAVYSRSQSFVFMINSNKTQKLIMLQGEKRPAEQALDSMRAIRTATSRTPELDEILGIDRLGAYTFTFDMNDPDTLRNEGSILFTFDPDAIGKLLKSSEAERRIGSNLVLFPTDKVVYDSKGLYSGLDYPYARQLYGDPGYAKLETKAYRTTTRTAKSGLYVSGIVPASELEGKFAGFKSKVIAITGIGIVLMIVFAYMTVYRYSRRTRAIIKAMKHAQQGNLSVRVPTGQNDELDEISDRFNRMCEELMSYINQVYVSEIKQKHAELVAFQAQINPHFLYNTLEAIRMRALTQGATDVGEMAYVLGSLFRYAVKPETTVTLGDEIEYCRQFLELYRLRFRDKMSYSISLEEGMESALLFKLSLQPLIENAIVHGVRAAKMGNVIAIRAYADAETSTLIVEVEDNGKGMDEERLQAVKLNLAGNGHMPGERAASVTNGAHSESKENKKPGGTSLGLRNVNERIRLLYGDGYGLDIRSKRMEGTVVRVRFPHRKEEV